MDTKFRSNQRTERRIMEKGRTAMTTEESILERVRALPPAKREDVLKYISSLDSGEGAAEEKKSFRSPKGILADLNFTLTEEDLAEARREMWGAFPRDDVA
jgi:hypothetical protein